VQPAVSDHDNASNQLSINEVEQLSRVLIPLVMQGLRPEFHNLRESISASIAAHVDGIGTQIDKLDSRVGNLESPGNVRLKELEARVTGLEAFKWKLLGAMGGAGLLGGGGVAALLKALGG
jgi:hypothetical protein